MNLAQLEQKVNALSARADGIAAGASKGSDVPTSLSNTTGTSIATLAGSSVYPINANDANQSTVYRMRVWGDLQLGTGAAGSFRWGIGCFGLNATTTPPMASAGIGAAPLGNWPASSFLEWVLTLDVAISVKGSSGACNSFIQGSLTKYQGPPASFVNLGNAIGSTVDNYSLCGGTSGSGIDTTAATVFAIQGFWTGGSSGQIVRYMGSTFERVGP